MNIHEVAAVLRDLFMDAGLHVSRVYEQAGTKYMVMRIGTSEETANLNRTFPRGNYAWMDVRPADVMWWGEHGVAQRIDTILKKVGYKTTHVGTRRAWWGADPLKKRGRK